LIRALDERQRIAGTPAIIGSSHMTSNGLMERRRCSGRAVPAPSAARGFTIAFKSAIVFEARDRSIE